MAVSARGATGSLRAATAQPQRRPTTAPRAARAHAHQIARVAGFNRRRDAMSAASKLQAAAEETAEVADETAAAPAKAAAKEAFVPIEPEEFEKLKIGEDIRPEYEKYWPLKRTQRRAGIIMHPTSLPGAYGTGEIGKQAMKFCDWVASAGLTMWQVLPLVPPEEKYWSPYSSTDANAGNPLMIGVEELVEMGLITKEDLPAPKAVSDADFNDVKDWKTPLLRKAALALLSGSEYTADLEAFKADNPWVVDSAIFDVLSRSEELDGLSWQEWPAGLRDRDADAIAKANEDNKEDVEVYIVLQFLFDCQWKALKEYANSKGVALLGDMPIYVSGHSVDVWANQELFSLGSAEDPGLVSGVPPDAFSETGQLWGTPLYDWAAHEAEGYVWWAGRLARAFSLYDECRIDHFRAFAGFWAVPGDSETAMTGSWKKGPGIGLFKALADKMGDVPIVAEDLGVITRDVVELREGIAAPGMVVLQFAWEGGPGNTHLPHNHYENSFCYPGTHDNETAVGWWRDSASPKAKKYLQSYLAADGIGPDGTGVNWALIDSSLQSVSRCTLVLMQDIMGLDNEDGRMNTPGKAEGNWAWRVGEEDIWSRLTPEAERLKATIRNYGRLPKKLDDEEEDDE